MGKRPKSSKPRFFLGIASRVLLPLLIILLLSFIVIGTSATNTISSTWLHQIEDASSVQYQLANNIVVQEYDDLNRKVHLLAESKQIAEALEAENQRQLLSLVVAEQLERKIDTIEVIDSAGRVVLNTDYLAEDLSLEAHEQALLGLMQLSGRYITTTQSGTSLNAYTHILSGSDEVVGVIVGSKKITTEWLAEKGEIVPSYVALKSNHGPIASNFHKYSNVTSLTSGEVSSILSSITASQDTSGRSERLFSSAGHEYFIRYAPLILPFEKEPALSAFIITPLDELSESLETIQQEYIVTISLTFLVVTILVYLTLTQRIIKPIQKLAVSATELSEGKYKQSSLAYTQDEIGILAHNFDMMVEKLQAVRQKEQALNRSKEEFVTIAAHQLRTPLTAIKWVFDFMKDSLDANANQSDRELLDTGLRSAGRMGTIINQILDTSKIDTHTLHYAFSENKLDELIRSRSDTYSLLAKNRGVQFTADFDGACGTSCVDPEKICMAIDNIVDNAIHYTPQGGFVHLNLTCTEKAVDITVADTGVGIDPSIQSKLFDKFTRGANARSMHTDGSGLGLYIAFNILREHNATTSIKENTPSGTIFKLHIPTNACAIDSTKKDRQIS